MTYYGSWANEILVGHFHAVLVNIIFGQETEHTSGEFSKENEHASGIFSKETEHVE